MSTATAELLPKYRRAKRKDSGPGEASVAPSDDINDVPVRFATCRALRHAWEPSSKVKGTVEIGLASLALVCLRCTAERIDGIDSYGRVKSRRYAYPEGYLRKPGMAKLDATDYRLRMLSARLDAIRIKR